MKQQSAKLGTFDWLLDSAQHEMLAVTYWFDPTPNREPTTVSIRFSGHRLGVVGKPQPRDYFVRDETIEGAVAGGGPISVTARVHGINPGEWAVKAEAVSQARAARRPRGRATKLPAAQPLHPAAWSWRRWKLSKGSTKPVQTCLLPFARVPGLIRWLWPAMVALGLIIGVATQAFVISREHLELGSLWLSWLLAIVLGFVGAKLWFVVLHWRDRRIEGWCIQGFLAGVGVAAAVILPLQRIPAGVFLDTAAPGAFLGLAVGRLGCFFGGCCYGRPTTSRWGVWSSDQRVGRRRIPTQLIESALAVSIGLGALIAILAYRPMGGAIFVGSLALYTLCRQGVLGLRAERRKSGLGGPLTAAAAALVLMADLAFVRFMAV